MILKQAGRRGGIMCASERRGRVGIHRRDLSTTQIHDNRLRNGSGDRGPMVEDGNLGLIASAPDATTSNLAQ